MAQKARTRTKAAKKKRRPPAASSASSVAAKKKLARKKRDLERKNGDLGRKTAFQCLTSRQALFVMNFLDTLNGRSAYLAAGYRPVAADAGASRLLRNVKVQKAIREEFEVRGITREAVTMSVAKIGLGSDIADFEGFLSGQKTLGDLRAMGVETALVQAATEKRVELLDKKKKVVGEVITRRLTMYNRLTALALLARVMGIMSERRVHSGKIDTGPAAVLDLKDKSDEELKRIACAVEPVGAAPDGGDTAGAVGDGQA